MFRTIVIAALSLASAVTARAETTATAPSDWPCRQAKVVSVALAGIWTGPAIDDAAKAMRDEHATADLATRISARRTTLEEAQTLVETFAKASGETRKLRLTALFAGVYERLEAERRQVLDGLDRYGARQKLLAEKLREETQAMRAEQDKTPPDAQKIKDASEALQWDLRVFDERRKALTYVCETPALIEQRLGALARTIESAID